jgi:hypothetical protein
VLSRTEIDADGTENDAERVSESRRDFRQSPELRRLVKYRQGIAIIDTADPILFRFLPRADNGDVAVPARRVLDPPQTLAEAVEAMKEIKRQTLSTSTPAESNGNRRDKTVTDELAGPDVIQPTPPETRPPGTDSVKVHRELRISLEEELLPFEPLTEEE